MSLSLLMKSPRSRKNDKKREGRRNLLFPKSEGKIWRKSESKGYTSLPRTLPLVMLLIKQLAKTGGNPAMAYLELWARDFGQGLVDIHDAAEHAYAAGYTSNRAVRTWSGHINKLETLGFVEVRRSGVKEIAHVLLLDPHRVIEKLREKGKLPDEWDAAFLAYCNQIGATTEFPPEVEPVPD